MIPTALKRTPLFTTAISTDPRKAEGVDWASTDWIDSLAEVYELSADAIRNGWGGRS